MDINTSATTNGVAAASLPSSSPSAPSPATGAPAGTDSPPAAASGSTTTTPTGAIANPKRRATRRANTAERRATHNAVERARRETLNGRFLSLATLLPPLAALRRPSKAAIVNSSIATVQAARRHRVLAAQTLRALDRETESLRMEVNEWRARARVPPLEQPVRTEAHGVVMRGDVEELEVELTFEDDFEDEDGEGEDGAQEDVAASHAQALAHAPMQGYVHAHAHHAQVQGRFAFEAPAPSSPSSASSASWDATSPAPRTPPTPGALRHAGLLARKAAAPAPMDAFDELGYAYAAHGYDPARGKTYAPAIAPAPASAPAHLGAGAAYDLGLGLFDLPVPAAAVPEDFALGMGMGMGAMAPMGMGMGMDVGLDMRFSGGGGWAAANPAHPAFHAQQQMMGMGMGATMPFGGAHAQFLHQPQPQPVAF